MRASVGLDFPSQAWNISEKDKCLRKEHRRLVKAVPTLALILWYSN